MGRRAAGTAGPRARAAAARGDSGARRLAMNGRPLTLPTCERLATALAGVPIVQLAFFPIYLGCGALTAMRDSPLRLYADWELAIPFWPFMIVPYLSMFVLFLMPPLQLD